MKKIFIFCVLLNLSLKAHNVVKDLDLPRFMGKWYVISLIPNWIEEGGTDSFDEYTLNKDGTIDIRYQTIKNGKVKTIRQKGVIADENIKSKWEIKFIKPWIPFFKAPYELIILDENYNYMAVGYPDNSFGWVMARSPIMEDSIYNEILDQLDTDFGYDKKKFEKVTHNKK